MDWLGGWPIRKAGTWWPASCDAGSAIWTCSGSILGTGEPIYHKLLYGLAKDHPERVAVRLEFSDRLAHLIEAGADMFLMPSRFEPCGLNQLYSLRYGTVPLVRTTGGLADTIQDANDENLAAGTANGFCFESYDVAALEDVAAARLRIPTRAATRCLGPTRRNRHASGLVLDAQCPALRRDLPDAAQQEAGTR